MKTTVARVGAGSSLGKLRVTLVAAGLVIVSQPTFMSNGTIFGATLLIAAFLTLMSARWRVEVPVSLVLFAIWAGVSVFWTHDRFSYPYAMTALVGTVAIGTAIATFKPREILRGLVIGSTLVLTASATLGYAAPDIGRVSTTFYANALSGIYSNKNSLATILVIGVAACLGAYAIANRTPVKLFFVALSGVHFLVLVDTNSSTGIVVAAILVVVYFTIAILVAMPRMARLGILPLLVVAVGGFMVPWAVRSADEITASLGRDLSLTGRTEIWRIVSEAIAQEPLLGYGWGGVWNSEVGFGIQSAFGNISANSAHQGFLEIALQLGLVGLALYLAVTLPAVLRSLRLASRSREHIWMIVLLASLVIYNFSEARAAQPIGIFVIAITAGAAMRGVRSLNAPGVTSQNPATDRADRAVPAFADRPRDR